MDSIDRRIINQLQGGCPVSERPFVELGTRLGVEEDDLIRRLDNLLSQGLLSRFGPMYNAERIGGGLTLAAMRIPPQEFDWVAATVNALPQVAHNYARDHEFNMWFVLATETSEEIDDVLADIEERVGYPVYSFPKIKEYYVGLRFQA